MAYKYYVKKVGVDSNLEAIHILQYYYSRRDIYQNALPTFSFLVYSSIRIHENSHYSMTLIRFHNGGTWWLVDGGSYLWPDSIGLSVSFHGNMFLRSILLYTLYQGLNFKTLDDYWVQLMVCSIGIINIRLIILTISHLIDINNIEPIL